MADTSWTEFRIRGNELQGYAIDEKVDGEWCQVTRRFSTYDLALTALNNIERKKDG